MKSYNALDMKGRLYDYSLEADQNSKGNLIKGEIKIEVDSAGTIVAIRFYVNEKTKAGKINRTFKELESILAGNLSTVVNDGNEASWIGLTGSVSVSYFKGRDSGTDDQLIRAQKLRGGFINSNQKKVYNNKWTLDFIITKVQEVEANIEKDLERFVKVRGYLVDDFSERLLEVEFQARSEKAMDYLLGQLSSATEDTPYFVSTWGQIQRISHLVVRKNAFGEDEQECYESFKGVITGMNPEPYDISDEVILGTDKFNEFKKALIEHKEEQLNKDNNSDGKQSILSF